MRIGMMVDVYKPHVSGVTNYIALNKRSLEQQGHEVFVFTFGDLDYKDDEPNIIRSAGLPLSDTGFYLSFRYSSMAQQLLATMDVVHVHHPFLSGRLTLRYCLPLAIPVVFTNHTRYDLYAQVYLPILPDAFGEAFLQAYLPTFCRSCNLVISPAQGMKEILQKFSVDPGNIMVIPNGVDLSPFSGPVEAIDRQELGFGEEMVLFIYTGRLGPEKNLPLLLRAFAGAAKAYGNIGLVIVGDGPAREDLVERVQLMGIADRVKFTGMVPYNNLPAYLAAADVFVTASISEVHPLSVVEAMASGLPVLGIKSPGISDIVADGYSGVICPEDEVAVFTALMVRMATDPATRRKMGENARAAAQQYAIERTSRLVLEQYTRLAGETSKRKRSLLNRINLMFEKLKW